MMKAILLAIIIGMLALPALGAEISVQMGSRNVEKGISSPSGADGVQEALTIAGRDCRAQAPGNAYFYFHVEQPEALPKSGSLYLTLNYYDDGYGRIEFQYDSADSGYPLEGAYKGGGAFSLSDTRTWQSWTFELRDARFAHRQNLGADFRFHSGIPMRIASVSISTEKPAGFESQRRNAMERLANSNSALKPRKGMSVCFGGVDVGENSQWPARVESLEEQCALYKSLGVTSTETYVTWSLAEGEAKDHWNWIGYDSIAQTLKRSGLKWVPFIIIGPSYATPGWFKSSDQSVFASCLDHNQDSDIQSIWNPNLLPWVDRFLGEFAKRYQGMDVIESVLIGISGDFGEAIMPVWGGGWTGDYHTHAGWWCGDRYAVANFRDHLRTKYSEIESLNAAWGTSYGSFAEIHPVLPDKAVSARAWLDQTTWYQDSMTHWADQWMALVRKHFPQTPLFLCTGGIAEREHASNFAAQCRIAAKHNAGVRITNEASSYAHNFFLTRWVASAGKFYGCYYGFEPAGAEDEKGIRARIYNVTASGACQYHTYQNNVTDSSTRIDSFRKHYSFLRPATPVVDVAAFIPRTWQMLHGDNFWDKARDLRGILDYDFVDPDMLRDGALNRYKALILLSGNIMEAEDLKRIDAWVRSGGMLIFYNSGPIKSVEGDASLYGSWLPEKSEGAWAEKAIGKGRCFYFSGDWNQRKGLFGMISEAVRRIPGRVEPDGVEDSVYATVLSDGILFLNTGDSAARKTITFADGHTRQVTIPANTIHLEKR